MKFPVIRKFLGTLQIPVLGFAICQLLGSTAAYAGAPSNTDKTQVNAAAAKPEPPMRIIAKLKAPAAENNNLLVSTLSDLGLEKTRSIKLVPGLQFIEPKPGANKVTDRESLKKSIKLLMETGLYEYVEADQLVKVQQLPDDQQFTNGTLWGLRNTGQNGGRAGVDVNAVPAWDITTGTNDVVVGVIDTGIRYTHNDLKENMWVNEDEIPGNNIDDDNNGFVDDVHGMNAINMSGNPMDDNGHGTHCAGTIAATAFAGGGHVGVAYNVRLMGLKFLSAGGSGATSDAIACVDYAVANGAKITNNSWGGGGASQGLLDSIRAANRAGVLFVAAAGNESSNNDSVDSYPANYDVDNVISVAAIDRAGNLANFSNYGINNVDLGAPGVAIYSTVSDSDTSYDSYNGTSMATPHVAGVAALLASVNPEITISEYRSRLLLTTTPLTSLQGRVATGGMVNAHSALTAGQDGDLDLRVQVDGLLEAGKENTIYVFVNDLVPVQGATVTAFFPNQIPTAFLDNGNFPDQVANDGKYSARINAPLPAGVTKLTVDASAPGKTPANQEFTLTSVSVPLNDDFADRIVLSGGTTSTNGSNVFSSSEPGEPRNPFGAGGKSVWWAWTAQKSGPATITTSGSSFDTTLAVYLGDQLNNLSLVASNDDSEGLLSSVTFSAIEGQVYAIQVDGYAGEEGTVYLNYPDPGFASSIPQIIRQPVGKSVLVGRELKVVVSAAGSPPLQFQWFKGNQPVEGATSPLYLKSAATVQDQGTYRVEVKNDFGTVVSQSVFVSVNLIGARPANDDFANAAELLGAGGNITGTNTLATGETGEPIHAGTAQPLESVWYKWQAPSGGVLSLNTFGSDFDTTLSVYTGTSVSSLIRAASNDDTDGRQSKVAFTVIPGNTYFIAVDGFGNEEGDISLEYDFLPSDASAPSNDMFANRIPITGIIANSAGDNTLATAEAGEPNHAESSVPIQSVWWSWTAPAHGEVTFSTENSNFDTSLAVYTGTQLANLSLIAFDDDSGPGSTSKVTFEVTPGTTYVISVDGYKDSRGLISLSTNFTANEGREPNDLFASRTRIGSASTVVTGSNIRAHGETGEPNHAGLSEPIQSVWWSWTAPADGTLTLNTRGSAFDTTMAVYTGQLLTNLTLVASNDDENSSLETSRCVVDVVAGREYMVAVDGLGTATGSIRLEVQFAPSNLVLPSTDAKLASLGISDGTLNPAFSPNVLSYSIAVPFATDSLVITPSSSDEMAVIAVNDRTLDSGSDSPAIPIVPGSNTIKIRVTAESGDILTYTLTVARAVPSLDANLSELVLSSGDLTPVFSSNVTTYRADLGSQVASIRIMPVTSHHGAAVTINGNAVPSGSFSNPLAMAVGNNEILVVVKAESGRERTYRITAVRAKSENNKLARLSISGAKLENKFSPNRLRYRATATKNKKSCRVSFAPAHPSATATINGRPWKQDQENYTIRLNRANTLIRIVVSAQNGSKRTYRINVRKK